MKKKILSVLGIILFTFILMLKFSSTTDGATCRGLGAYCSGECCIILSTGHCKAGPCVSFFPPEE